MLPPQIHATDKAPGAIPVKPETSVTLAPSQVEHPFFPNHPPSLAEAQSVHCAVRPQASHLQQKPETSLHRSEHSDPILGFSQNVSLCFTSAEFVKNSPCYSTHRTEWFIFPYYRSDKSLLLFLCPL